MKSEFLMNIHWLDILDDWHICPATGIDKDYCDETHPDCHHQAPKHWHHTTPKVTVDIIIEMQDWHLYPFGQLRLDGTSTPMLRKDGIVLISRVNEPLGWALPGGFVDIGERAIDAAAREATEETGLHITQLEQFHTYPNPGRDSRFHAISIVYIAKAIGYPEAADDAKEARIVDPKQLGATMIDSLCFDHQEIITDYLIFNRTGKRPTRE